MLRLHEVGEAEDKATVGRAPPSGGLRAAFHHLQVGLTSAPAPSSGAADSTASLPGSSHHASELSMAGLEGSLRAAADDPGVCGDGVALDAASTMSISPTGDPCQLLKRGSEN